MAAKLTPGRGRPTSTKGRKAFLKRFMGPALGCRSEDKVTRAQANAALKHVMLALDEPMGFDDVEAWLRFLQQTAARDYMTAAVIGHDGDGEPIYGRRLESRDFIAIGAKLGGEMAKVVGLREALARPQVPDRVIVTFIHPDLVDPDELPGGDRLIVG